MGRTRTALKEVVEPEATVASAPLPPALSAGDLTHLRVAFARDAMMQTIGPCFDPRNVGVNLNDAAEFSVRAADALIAALTKGKG